MKRWCVCKIGPYEDPNSRSAKIALYTDNWRVWPHPTKQWCVAHFSAADLTAILADPDIYLLPDATLDVAWSTIPNNVRNQVRTAMLTADFVWGVQNNWTVRQVLNYAVAQLQGGALDVGVGDVKDPN